MTEVKTQEILRDLSATGRERPWRTHRIGCDCLATIYSEIDPGKAERVSGCATRLTFTHDEGALKLSEAWFCRVRLCPMCMWRRALKVGAQVSQIMDSISKEHSYKYILLTLTVRNCEGAELSAQLDELFKAYTRLIRRKQVADVVKGWYRAIEITHNLKDDTYHPHIHAVLAVPAGYFSGGRYIKQEGWTQLWKEALRADYTPIVDIRTIKGNTGAAVAEVAKYAVKSSDYIIPDDWDLSVATIQLLDQVLANRRFIGFGGIFKDMARQLKLKDPEEDDDLIHIDGEAPSEAGERVITFVWYSGYRQYIID